MKVNTLVLGPDTQFEEAISLLDANGNGVLPVVDKDNKFVGLITDGDIRKAILNKNLDLENVINKSPFKFSADTTKQEQIQFLKSIRRRHLPLVDDQDRYVGLLVLDDLDFNSKPNSVVIMAGGLGTRLGDLTRDTPKPMLHVGNRPILESILENFIHYGFSNFYLAVNFRADQIKSHFGDGKKWGVKISYLHEQEGLGTAGGLTLMPKIPQEPVIVANGDVIATVDYEDLLRFHEAQKATATMCTREYEFKIPYAVVEKSGDVIDSLKEKPAYRHNVSAGIYVLNPEALSYIPHNTCFDMPNLFENLIVAGKKTSAYLFDGYWIDIGHINEFQKANKDWDSY